MGSLWRDLQYSFRRLIIKPAFTAVALVSLGLGIGANTTIFSVFNTIMIRSFPLKDPERLVMPSGFWVFPWAKNQDAWVVAGSGC